MCLLFTSLPCRRFRHTGAVTRSYMSLVGTPSTACHYLVLYPLGLGLFLGFFRSNDLSPLSLRPHPPYVSLRFSPSPYLTLAIFPSLLVGSHLCLLPRMRDRPHFAPVLHCFRLFLVASLLFLSPSDAALRPPSRILYQLTAHPIGPVFLFVLVTFGSPPFPTPAPCCPVLFSLILAPLGAARSPTSLLLSFLAFHVSFAFSLFCSSAPLLLFFLRSPLCLILFYPLCPFLRPSTLPGSHVSFVACFSAFEDGPSPPCALLRSSAAWSSPFSAFFLRLLFHGPVRPPLPPRLPVLLLPGRLSSAFLLHLLLSAIKFRLAFSLAFCGLLPRLFSAWLTGRLRGVFPFLCFVPFPPHLPLGLDVSVGPVGYCCPLLSAAWF